MPEAALPVLEPQSVSECDLPISSHSGQELLQLMGSVGQQETSVIVLTRQLQQVCPCPFAQSCMHVELARGEHEHFGVSLPEVSIPSVVHQSLMLVCAIQVQQVLEADVVTTATFLDSFRDADAVLGRIADRIAQYRQEVTTAKVCG